MQFLFNLLPSKKVYLDDCIFYYVLNIRAKSLLHINCLAVVIKNIGLVGWKRRFSFESRKNWTEAGIAFELMDIGAIYWNDIAFGCVQGLRTISNEKENQMY